MITDNQNVAVEQQAGQETSRTKSNQETGAPRTFEVVEFDLAGGRYAIDINLVREIVEMVPITPIPRAPHYITGVINLRGEITNIVNLTMHLHLPDQPVTENQKIIVFTADTVKGNNVGIVVDSISSVTTVTPSQIKSSVSSDEERKGKYVKAIISFAGEESSERHDGLVIWLDILKLFKDIESKQSPAA